MKKIILKLIKFYMVKISPYKKPCCRFVPTCSQYCYEAVEKYGVLKGGFFRYRRMYYRQAVAIAKQSIKMRHKFQMAGKITWKDRVKIYTDFNFQDVCNRVAALVPWLFD